jgi:type VI secretion system protein ImpF
VANKPAGSITLPLLDRLTDEDPKRGEEVALSRSKSLAALKVAVRRDLEWLLNTRRAERDLPPNVLRSVFCYGLPESSSVIEDRGQVFQDLAKRMEAAIATFEPRLAGVKVMLSPHQDKTIRRIDLVIEGLLRIDPSPEHVSFDTSLELTSGEYHVKGEAGG